MLSGLALVSSDTRGARDVRRARIATTVAFATNGALPVSLMARYAEVKEILGLTDAVFGLVVASYLIGAALALNLPGVILRRVGTRITTTVGTVWVATWLAVAAGGVAIGQVWLVLAGLLLAGWADSIVDVAQNAQGLGVQSARGSSVLNSMHAGWSAGAALGGAVGTMAASLGVPLVVHMGLWGVICAVTMTLAGRSFLTDRHRTTEGEQQRDRLNWRVVRYLLPLVVLALAGISVEDIGNNWSAVLLSTERGVAAASAGVGLSVLLAAQFIGRLAGDRFVDRIGEHRAVIVSLSGTSTGLLAAAWAPAAGLTVAGLALAGLSSAITVPLAFAHADRVPGLPAHSGVTWVVLAMRVSAIGLTPAIGAMSSASSLPLAITVVTGLSVLALALQVRRSDPAAAAH